MIKLSVTDSANNEITTISFGSRPAGGTSSFKELRIWNDIFNEGADTAENVYLISRKKHTEQIDVSSFTIDLPSIPSYIHEVSVNGELKNRNTEWSSGGNTITFNSPLSISDEVEVLYDDEDTDGQIMSVLSEGVIGSGIIDDAESTYTKIGGTEFIEENLGTANGEMSFTLSYAPVVEDSLTVYVDGVETNVVFDSISGVFSLLEEVSSSAVITATYIQIKSKKIGDIPPGCARIVYVRLTVPSSSNKSVFDPGFEVFATPAV